MPFASPSQTARARRSRRATWPRSSIAFLFAISIGAAISPGLLAASRQAEAPAAQEHAAPVAASQGAAATGEHGAAAEGEHAEGALPTIARLFNFAVLVGLLVYFLRTPLSSYLASRHAEIREELVKAAELRAAATTQLADVQQKMSALPAELDALRAQGAEDVVAERARISQATATERERLLAHTRREIEMQLRLAKRALIEHGAQLAVDVAQTRIVNTITPEDQLRLVDRYTTQLREAR
jgi:F-type H+-transporting ATPase subunit b